MQVFKKVKKGDYLLLVLLSTWINKKFLQAAIKTTIGLSEENNGMRFYLCDMFGSYYILSSIEIKDINTKMPKDKRMQFDELMKCCIYYKDKNGEFMKPEITRKKNI